MTKAKPFLVLGAALLLGVIILLAMPMAAEPLAMALGGEGGPSAPLAEGVFTLAIFLVMIGAGLVGGRLSGMKALQLGRDPGKQLGLGLLIGLVGVLLALGHGYAANILGNGPGGLAGIGLFAIGTLLVLIQVGAEEIFFRGWLQGVLVDGWGAVVGIGVTALSFAALHLMGGAMHPVSFVNLALGGVLFGVLAWRSGGIAGALGAHFAWNWSEAMVVGLFPNPGIGSFGSLVDLELAGSGWWGGSEEGLNASLGMTAVLLALLVLVIAPGRRAPRPLSPAAA